MLGPVRNFSIMASEFVQILRAGRSHWVCVSYINCPPGIVNLYDRLFNGIIENEEEEQVKSLFGGNFQGTTDVPVQQQLNGSIVSQGKLVRRAGELQRGRLLFNFLVHDVTTTVHQNSTWRLLTMVHMKCLDFKCFLSLFAQHQILIF